MNPSEPVSPVVASEEADVESRSSLSEAKRRFYPPSESDIPMHGWRPYSDVHRERIRAHIKHDVNNHSMERREWTDPVWLPVLTEEVGEVARVLCEGEDGLTAKDAVRLREELVQVAAMAVAWIDAIDLTPALKNEKESLPTEETP